jgi:hypothetical protein
MEGLFDSKENLTKLITNVAMNHNDIRQLEQPESEKRINVESQDWFTLLEQSGAEIIVHEAINNFSGQLYPLIIRLYFEKNWKMVYLDGNVLIFLKNIQKFQDQISRLEKPKGWIFDEIIWESKYGIRNGRSAVPTVGNYSNFYANLAFGLIAKGQTDDRVEVLIENALLLSSDNFSANLYKNLLKEIKKANS